MTHTYAVYKTPLRTKDLQRLKVKGWKKYSKQIDKATTTITKTPDPEGHFIIFKGKIHQEDKNIVNIYASNIGTLK